MPSAGKDSRNEASWGSHRAGGKTSVPLIDATPGRFQGPNISQRITPWATKLRPRPAKISLTPPFVFKKPAIRAHRAPPIRPAIIDPRIIIDGIWLSSPKRKTAVVKTAPIMTWPSIPIFHNPIRKVNSKPQAHKVSGIQLLITWENLIQDPSDPLKI